MTETASRTRARRKPLLLVVSLLVLGLLAWYVNQNVSMAELARQESRIRDYIVAYPWSAFGIGFTIYTVLALVPGTGGKAVASGWLFGFWQAMAIVTVGLAIGAMVIFALSRYLIRDTIERRYKAFLEAMNRHLEKEGAFYLLTLRMAHVPYSLVNPVSGASRVSTWTFLWTTVVGLAPPSIIWIYVGIKLPSLRELEGQGPGALLDPMLLVALVASGFLPLLMRGLIWLIKSRTGGAATTGDQPSRRGPFP